MAYTRHEWTCGEVVTDEALNNLEAGVEAVQPMMLTFGGTTQEEADDAIVNGAKLNATWQEVNDAFRAGRRIVAVMNPYLAETLGGTSSASLASEVLDVGTGAEGSFIYTKPTVTISWMGSVRALTCDTVNDYPQTPGTPIG